MKSNLDQHLISDNDFFDIIQNSKNTLSHLVSTQKIDSILPIFTVATVKPPSNDLQIIIIGIPDFTNKYETLKSLGNEFFQKQLLPQAITLSSEAWLVNPEKNEKITGSLSNHPKKQEVAMVSGLTLDKRTAFSFSHITRNQNNQISLNAFNETVFGNIQADLLNAFYQGFVSNVQHLLKENIHHGQRR